MHAEFELEAEQQRWSGRRAHAQLYYHHNPSAHHPNAQTLSRLDRQAHGWRESYPPPLRDDMLPLVASLTVAVSTALAYTTLSDTTIQHFPLASEVDFDIHNQQGLLAPILIPRVPGTEGSAQVRQHFVNFFNTLPEWNVQWQNSSSTTPTSNGQEVPFVNLIATRDPPWVKTAGDVGRLTLVAHYDSLSIPKGFVGAIDSAAPCAMLLHVARSIDSALTKKWEKIQAAGVSDLEEQKGVQILLLDGEEAFMRWSDTDSVYGARALAAEWEQTLHPVWSAYRNPLESIDLFMLLDLLGAAHPLVPSYFKTTHWAYQKYATVEARLRQADRMKTGRDALFLYEAQKTDRSSWAGGQIGDDHVPFMAKGVEVLHVIPSVFPAVWHTLTDDGEHLDMNTVLDWATLTSAFAAEWLELDDFVDHTTRASGPSHVRTEKSEFD